ncbi:MAG: fibronectin type III domain-containing protein [Actinomycetota bacterium]
MNLRPLVAFVLALLLATVVVPGVDRPAAADIVSFRPPEVPGPVRDLEASSGDGQILVVFDEPATAVAIERYQVRATNLTTGQTTALGGTTSRSRLLDRDDGHWYRIEVWAESTEGAGPSTFAFARTAQQGPVGGTIFHLAPEAVPDLRGVPGDGSVTLEFGTPESTLPVLDHRVQVTDLTTSATRWTAGSGSPLLVDGLDDGTWYRFEIQARSAHGFGRSAVTFARSGPPDPPVPSVPGPVRELSTGFASLFGDGVVLWSPPSGDPREVLGYQLRLGDELVEIRSLRPRYEFPMQLGESVLAEVRAIGPGGRPGPWSSEMLYASTTPSAPVLTSVGQFDGTVTIAWDPSDGGGFPVDRYDVRIGDRRTTLDGDARSWSASGFTAGERVEIKLRARNVRSWSDFERETITIAESTPGPVRGLSSRYLPDDGVVVVTWEPPVSGGEVIGYEVEGAGATTRVDARRWELPLARSETVGVVVRAVGPDAVGPDARLTVRGGTEPGAPVGLTVTPQGDDAVLVEWSPGDDGGFALWGDILWVDGGYRTMQTGVTAFVVDGLTPGSIEVEVWARNVIGRSPSATTTVVLGTPDDSPPPADPPPADDPPAGDSPPVDDPPPADDPPADDPPPVDDPPAGGSPPADLPAADRPPAGDPTAADDPSVGDAPVPTDGPGYWMAEAAGSLYGFGDADRFVAVEGRAVAVGTDADGNGLWVLTDDGVVHVRGDARHHGDADPRLVALGERVTSIAVRPTGDGYWVFTDRGRAIAFGAAPDHGDMVGTALNGRIVASAATATGDGYWLVGSDGGIFSFGDAVFAGSTGSLQLNEPVVGIAPDPDGSGYWLVAADGGIFAFDADFRGSVPGVLPVGASLNAPVIGAIAFGDGYLMVASDGGIFAFSDEGFLGSLGGVALGSPIVGVAAFTN